MATESEPLNTREIDKIYERLGITQAPVEFNLYIAAKPFPNTLQPVRVMPWSSNNSQPLNAGVTKNAKLARPAR